MDVSLHAARTAILSANQNQSVIANNLANITTTGFKKVRQEQSNFIVPGTQTAGHVRDYSEGDFKPTNRPLDVSIKGDGFFQVDDNGTEAYTRSGSFFVDRDGNLVTAQGHFLSPRITIPEGNLGVEIQSDGRVLVRQQNGTLTEAGQLDAARFPNNQGLISIGNGLFREGPDSGTALSGTFGEEGFPSLVSGTLEESNVELAEELTSELVNQRWYQANLRVFQTSDEMLGDAVDMIR